MSTTTTNLGLKKPATTDYYNIQDFNDNAETLDTFAGNTITTDKLINNASATETGFALDARMGKTFGDQINAINNTMGTHTTEISNITTSLSENTQNIAKFGNKNYAINGNFDIWQRGGSIVNPVGYTFLADRFLIANGITGTAPTTLTHSRQSFTNGEVPNASNFYRLASDSLGILNSNDAYGLVHSIENGVRKLCGLNKKITLSFWARSSITNKKIGVFGRQIYGSGGTPSTPESTNGTFFNLTSTWQKFSVTLNTITLNGKTFGTNNDDNFRIWLYVAYGVGNANAVGDTVGELFGNGTVDIAQVKIESGDKTTPFVPRLYGEELESCYRYYRGNTGTAYLVVNDGTNIYFNLPVTTQMRTVPSVVGTPFTVYNSINNSPQSGFTFSCNANSVGAISIMASKASNGITAGYLVLNSGSGLDSEIY